MGLPHTMKNGHRPLFLLHQTLHMELCIPPNPDSSIRLPDSETCFLLQTNAFPLLQSPMARDYTTPADA
uniref:Uncharacterized protein n=1 Tax=Anguilla anguilla TaxID=7936 RepID=A0A0E9URU5_ANGAN